MLRVDRHAPERKEHRWIVAGSGTILPGVPVVLRSTTAGYGVGRTVPWRALLVRQVRIALARRRVRTVVDNLLDRARVRLSGCGWAEIADAAGRVTYRRAGSDRPYRELSGRQIQELAEQVRIVPRRAPEQGDRAPRVYTGRALDAVLHIVLNGAPGGVTVRDLAGILELVLTDWVPRILDFTDTGTRGQAADLTPEELTEVQAIAGEVVSELSSGEEDILRGRLAGLPDTDIAARLGVSRPTLIRRRDALFERLGAAAADLRENAREALLDEIVLHLIEASGTTEGSNPDD
ncbi:MAG: hypothetical protein OXG52_05700 [bacterium]|nr:hypothetical protein [bacterium]